MATKQAPVAAVKPKLPTITPKVISVCADGMNTARFEELSAARAGKTVQEWRNAVVESARKATAKDMLPWANDHLGIGKNSTKEQIQKASDLANDQATEIRNVAEALAGKTADTTPWTSPGQLENLLDGKVPGFTEFGGNEAGYRQHKQPLWQYLEKQKLAYEAHWQRETTVSFVNSAGKKEYVNPEEISYFIVPGMKPSQKGMIAKITVNGKSVYARALEAGPKSGELSLKGWKNLGFENVNPRASPSYRDAKGNLQWFGKNQDMINKEMQIEFFEGTGGGLGEGVNGAYPQSSFLNDAEIQRAGEIMAKQHAETGKFTPIRNKADLDKAEGKTVAPKQASADPAAAAGAGGNKLLHGFVG